MIINSHGLRCIKKATNQLLKTVCELKFTPGDCLENAESAIKLNVDNLKYNNKTI